MDCSANLSNQIHASQLAHSFLSRRAKKHIRSLLAGLGNSRDCRELGEYSPVALVGHPFLPSNSEKCTLSTTGLLQLSPMSSQEHSIIVTLLALYLTIAVYCPQDYGVFYKLIQLLGWQLPITISQFGRSISLVTFTNHFRRELTELAGGCSLQKGLLARLALGSHLGT